MAEQSKAAKPAKATPAPAEDKQPTKRVILRRERAIIMPEGLTAEQVAAVLGAVSDTKHIKSPKTEIAWVVVGEQEGTQREAIEAHAGKPGTPDALPGDYKAPPARGWAGGERYVRPPAPKIEREALVD